MYTNHNKNQIIPRRIKYNRQDEYVQKNVKDDIHFTYIDLKNLMHI